MSEKTVDSGPIQLSREDDFRLGALQISPSARQVIRNGQCEVLEPKAMQVLVVLNQAEGRVVSRDDLIARCWDGRIVGEDAINRVIWRLRRLSEADDGASFMIETIPKVGYRLAAVAPDQRLQPAAQQGLANPPESILASLFFRHRLAVAGAVLVAVAGAAAWLLWPRPHWMVEGSRPFISTLALEGEPAFSPDGKMLAYSSGADALSRKIYVRNVAGGSAIKVTSDSYDDSAPSWSPDGTRLAYVARKPGEPCRIMVTTAPAGEARLAGRCARAESSSISWQPGTSFLFHTDEFEPSNNLHDLSEQSGDRGTYVITRLDLDSGDQLTLPRKSTNPIAAGVNLICSPDGKSLLLVGRETASTLDLVIHDLGNDTERVLGKILVNGSAAWSEDSRTVLTATASGIGSEITAYPIDGEAPYHVYAAATNVSHLAAGTGGLLALETDPSRQNLARASAMPISQPEIIDPANGRSWAPTFAPDGTLAFLSNRTGTNAIWIMKPGGKPALLYDGGFSPLYRLEFSPDGNYLAMPIAANDGVAVNILTPDGANIATLHSPALGAGAPTWTPDSKEVILFDRPMLQYMRIAIADPARRRAAAPPRWNGIVFHGGDTFAGRIDRPGYWRLDKEPKLITSKYPLRWEPPPALSGEDLLVPDFDAPDGPRILAQPLAGGSDRVLAYAPGAMTELGLQSKMAVNPKTGEIIYVAAVQSDTNIDLLTLAKR